MTVDIQGPFGRALLKFQNAVIEKILSDIPPPNAPSTIRKKKSSHTLIDTGRMLSEVKIQVSREGDVLVGEVGIFDPGVAEYAEWNEYGTDRIPERSFLRSAFEENKDRIMNELEDKIFDNILKEFYK